MKKFKHIDESFDNILDSSVIDYSDQFEKNDIKTKEDKIKNWIENCVLNYTQYHSSINPNKRWKLNDNFEIPVVNGWIRFKFSHNGQSFLTDSGEIPDYIKIGKISQGLWIENFGGLTYREQQNKNALTSFKNFPKTVKKKLIFETQEKLTSLEGIPIIDLSNSTNSSESSIYNQYGEIDFKESTYLIGTPSKNPEDLFKEILLYCDFIKGTNWGQDEIKIKYGPACSYANDKYYWECYLRKWGNRKYIRVGKAIYSRFGGGREFIPVNLILDENGNVVEDKD